MIERAHRVTGGSQVTRRSYESSAPALATGKRYEADETDEGESMTEVRLARATIDDWIFAAGVRIPVLWDLVVDDL